MMNDPAEQNIIAHVRDHGWSIMKVAPATDSDDAEEWFAYTIGLPNTFGWPELICLGMDSDVVGPVLNNAVAELRDSKLTPTSGLQLHDVLNGSPVKLQANPQIPSNYLGYAKWFAGHSGRDMPTWLQLLWPDKQGRFPGEAGCVTEVVQLQTPIGAP
ncbi:DUF4262 domain-containing protein [Sphingomonas sp. BN140010]|uniref:DUF4262 domain-containing protein n=1 Tax=Sphingomonas arvum TaxID=2992113 RepID=A0ABT3JHQ4_9SPHN|nr:DUF4262 domain-containing protein [Sphingomonas sp. BN140010]MCW3798597.1 DUF4262 domain-containing protein [Sphingomonas sp. BN140010]